MFDKLKSNKKTALVIGASSDIGVAISVALAQEGYELLLHYNKNEGFKNKIKNLEPKVTYINADLSNPEAVDNIFEAFDKIYPELCLMVNCAAYFSGRKSCFELTLAEIVESTQVNFISAYKLSIQSALRMAGDGCSIIHITSQSGIFGGNNISAYACAKGAMNTMIVALSRELGPKGIRINGVSPGVIDTKMHEVITREEKAALSRSIPLGRLGNSEDVANAVMWLASHKASYITGAILPVSGGR